MTMPAINSMPCTDRAPGGRRAFTLVEVLVTMTIFIIGLSLTSTVFLAAVKRAFHTEKLLKASTELRTATDFISQTARSAPVAPVVRTSGTQVLIAPKDLGFIYVQDTTWIDTLHNVKGSKSNQRMLHVADTTPSIVTVSVFASAARPPGALSSSDVATYLVDGTSLPVANLDQLFAVGDTITIPATSYGPATTGVINSISNNSGTRTLTLTSALGVDVPNGTKIAATSGRRCLFSVEASGDLRYYPDSSDLTSFSVLAHDIDPAPLSNPADTSSARTVPFTLSGRYLTINLQKLPRGSLAGRTVQGVQTTVFARTDPLIP
ncbi:MAG: type II secretion system protein [Verrucomicrobia bacterium]|nr:type II secretion system protein [Verrucomicrobiota bacterium]